MNRIRKKHFENIVMLRGCRPQALITWEKKYAVRLVIVDGLDSTLEATREPKSATGIDVCIETVRNALKEAYLGLAENLLKCTKIGLYGRRWFLVMRQKSTVYALMELVGVGFVIKKTFQHMPSNR
jgi:hypothetical protein